MTEETLDERIKRIDAENEILKQKALRIVRYFKENLKDKDDPFTSKQEEFMVDNLMKEVPNYCFQMMLHLLNKIGYK